MTGVPTMSQIKPVNNQKPCQIHSRCIHIETCNRTMCLLFFEPATTFKDLKDAVREWLRSDRLETLHSSYDSKKPTDIERFVFANREMFKTSLIYTVMSKVIFLALMEVLDE